MKKGIWSTDWFVALVICLGFAVAAYLQTDAIEGLERAAYDWGVQRSSREPSDRIAVIAIDNESIANLGRWPWPRDTHAQMIELLREGGAKVIGLLVFYSEPQVDPGQLYIEAISDTYAKSGVEIPLMAAQLDEALTALDTDGILARQIGLAGNVVLPMAFDLREPIGRPDYEPPPFLIANTLENIEDPAGTGAEPWPTREIVTPPIKRIGEQALAVGHMNAWPDSDGGNRHDMLVLRHFEQYFPSVALQIAARSLNLGPSDITVNLGTGVQLGGLTIATDHILRMNTFYYDDDDGAAFQVDSFYDVFVGDIKPEKYAGKIVLIGASAVGVGDPQKTPIAAAMPPVVSMAHAVSSILEEDFFVAPPWAWIVELLALVLVSAYLIALFPRLGAGSAAGVSVAIVVVLLVIHFVLMTTQAMWIRLAAPVLLVVVGHVLLTTKRFLMTERGKLKSDAESAETNRMLGLAYQGKGDLDAAFASFRKVRPVDEALLDLAYNLALDFERKRQFNKAVSVYGFIAEHNSGFRDIESRMNRSKALEDTVLLGAGGGTGPGGTMLLDGGGVQKPMLGRYEVEKELGKGAMGVVYLGKDPKINRVVAIKTMALSQEFEADEVDEVKERFFREAETAGRLTHPNIVTIFDAGEEHDLAYIAMEFLKGEDLAKYTKPGSLLPVQTVVDIVLKSADALDYAHGENVVHRDIKPANIMYEAGAGSVKLTDFGIARITDSSKTKTGMVLGTPSYMSPEQLSGKKVDGRSDLFSLGVMLYQMLAGQLPFQGDSMATLMFKIANEPHPDLTIARPDLPPCLNAIINKALAKAVNDRYSRGAQMVEDLRACASQLAA